MSIPYNLPQLIDHVDYTLKDVRKFLQDENARREIEHEMRLQEAERRLKEIRPV